jgi:hypothetical protein
MQCDILTEQHGGLESLLQSSALFYLVQQTPLRHQAIGLIAASAIAAAAAAQACVRC